MRVTVLLPCNRVGSVTFWNHVWIKRSDVVNNFSDNCRLKDNITATYVKVINCWKAIKIGHINSLERYYGVLTATWCSSCWLRAVGPGGWAISSVELSGLHINFSKLHLYSDKRWITMTIEQVA